MEKDSKRYQASGRNAIEVSVTPYNSTKSMFQSIIESPTRNRIWNDSFARGFDREEAAEDKKPEDERNYNLTCAPKPFAPPQKHWANTTSSQSPHRPAPNLSFLTMSTNQVTIPPYKKCVRQSCHNIQTSESQFVDCGGCWLCSIARKNAQLPIEKDSSKQNAT
ncbi:hypothetical protein K458DRAFT_406082 [Lentithecium fluviatile CBS 122367]|uniref:Uncharacterized protein n=1 Tax=Lentithecium fluviatile CBS 122367 TaxID=1168545 RepID=A0A6G1IV79_9PLEO|nr:hypothetical protein K458DRAFT_406082 [Lentithecium fluviatile CBS 122367]